jgi:hypothetical protein
MGELKKYFSGEEGVRRSEVFIKFAKLLTGGGDDDDKSPSKDPDALAVTDSKGPDDADDEKDEPVSLV